MTESWKNDLRLIEAGFPCHQVGAETQRERGASSALPPLYFLHVWWARRPLTPSRAAILASLLPADTDPDWFLQQLGIEKRVVEINGVQWILNGDLLKKISEFDGEEVLYVDDTVIRYVEKENKIRTDVRVYLNQCRQDGDLYSYKNVIEKWERETVPLPEIKKGTELKVSRIPADPAWANEKKDLGKASKNWFPGDPYGYPRAFQAAPSAVSTKNQVVLDPTAGGGSIPFEALRLGYKVIANELNPVASVILHATLEYPSKFGTELIIEIKNWGKKLLDHAESLLCSVFPDQQPLPSVELKALTQYLSSIPESLESFNNERIIDYLYCRQVTCPNCSGKSPLLNTCWLSKVSGDQWGVQIIPDGRQKHGEVRFETYRAAKGKGPAGEDPDFATINRGVGTCIHCRQAISAEEIKAQARGESSLGKWKDRLYTVVAVRFQPKLDKNGQPQRYKSGEKKGEIKTEKVRFFRPPNQQDLAALQEAEKRLQENWDRWDANGLIPTEKFPKGNDMRPVNYGMPRWCDMFTPRQLLGHVTLVEELNRLKPEILSELGEDKGRAVVTYLQFAIDKGLDYNSRQTLWHASRGVIAHTFTRHDFSFKWTFGEMIFTGPNSGFAWGVEQVSDSISNIAKLIYKNGYKPNLSIINGTAAYLEPVEDSSVDLVCIDPPYYNNVQYAELSDYFYVWMKRTLKDLYPAYFQRRLTNKNDEAVANPDRDGTTQKAKATYENTMGEIFQESYRVLKPDGLMTLMFNHKSQEAWEALTKSIITNGWIITASFPVESESSVDIHHKEMAATVSSIFISCRKRVDKQTEPALWTGFGGTGVQQRIQQAVEEGLKEFQPLSLSPVDEMVASYGRALRVLSEQWPVIDGDEEVGPIRAMNEASRVVSENQIRRITNGRLNVEDLSPEAAMAVTLFGIYRLGEIPYDEVLNLSRSLNIAIENKTGGYVPDGRFIGYNTQSGASARAARSKEEDSGFQAPLVRKGSKLRIARPEERHPRRMEFPQTEWDLLCGTIMSFREGDVPVARAYLDRHAEGKQSLVLDLLDVWAAEVPDEKRRKEARAILFGFKSSSG